MIEYKIGGPLKQFTAVEKRAHWPTFYLRV